MCSTTTSPALWQPQRASRSNFREMHWSKRAMHSNSLKTMYTCWRQYSLQKATPITHNQITTHVAPLKSDREVFTDISKLSTWGYGSRTWLSIIIAEGIESYVAAHPKAIKFSKEKMHGYDVLDSMWCGHDSRTWLSWNFFGIPTLIKRMLVGTGEVATTPEAGVLHHVLWRTS